MGNFITNIFSKGKIKKEIIEDIIKEVKHTSNTIPFQVTEDHPIFHKALQNNISQDFVIKHLNSVRKEHLMKFMTDRIGDDNMIDDEEYNQIKQEAHRIAVELDETTEKSLDVYREYFRIISGKMDEIITDIFLDKNEKCYMISPIAWYEYRKVPKRINYGGLTGRIKIAKGISYRYGSVALNRVSQDELVKIDIGTVYFTDKRIIFKGNFGNKSIPLSKIIDIEEYSNGLTIQRATGKSPFLEMENPHKGNLILSKCQTEE